MEKLSPHTHYVQGVAWDPLDRYLVSISCDRTARVFTPKGGNTFTSTTDRELFRTCNTPKIILKRRDYPSQETTSIMTSTALAENENEPLTTKRLPNSQNLFVDENLSSFFRRPAWSPEGDSI